jgi:hypothetical protein
MMALVIIREVEVKKRGHLTLLDSLLLFFKKIIRRNSLNSMTVKEMIIYIPFQRVCDIVKRKR